MTISPFERSLNLKRIPNHVECGIGQEAHEKDRQAQRKQFRDAPGSAAEPLNQKRHPDLAVSSVRVRERQKACSDNAPRGQIVGALDLRADFAAQHLRRDQHADPDDEGGP